MLECKFSNLAPRQKYTYARNMCTSAYVWEVDDGHDITVLKTLRCTHFGMQGNIKNKPAARFSSNNLNCDIMFIKCSQRNI